MALVARAISAETSHWYKYYILPHFLHVTISCGFAF